MLWKALPACRKVLDEDTAAKRVRRPKTRQYSSRNINVVTDRSHSVIT